MATRAQVLTKRLHSKRTGDKLRAAKLCIGCRKPLDLDQAGRNCKACAQKNDARMKDKNMVGARRLPSVEAVMDAFEDDSHDTEEHDGDVC